MPTPDDDRKPRPKKPRAKKAAAPAGEKKPAARAGGKTTTAGEKKPAARTGGKTTTAGGNKLAAPAGGKTTTARRKTPAARPKSRATRAPAAAEPPITVPPRRLERGVSGPLLAVLPDGGSRREPLSDAVCEQARALGADVATVELGSRWELEAAGVVLDWSAGDPPRVAAGTPSREPTGARAPAVLDAIRRVKAALGDHFLVAASVTGPVAATAAVVAASAPAPGIGTPTSGPGPRGPAAGGTGRPAAGASAAGISSGARTPAAASSRGPSGAGVHVSGDLGPAVRLVLTASRMLCEAGATLVWIVEDGRRPPADAAGLARALAPVLGLVRSHFATPVLLLPGPADGWLDAVKRLRQLVPCFDPDLSPALHAELAAKRRPFGVLAAPDHALARDPGCVLALA